MTKLTAHPYRGSYMLHTVLPSSQTEADNTDLWWCELHNTKLDAASLHQSNRKKASIILMVMIINVVA